MFREPAVSQLATRIVAVLIFVAFLEEFFFRGYVQARLNDCFGKPFRFRNVEFGAGLILAAAVFGLAHPLTVAGGAPWAWALWTTAGGLIFGFLREKTGAVVAVTGTIDYVTDGARRLEIENGHPLMTRVTALGCTVSAMVAAFLVVEPDPLAAAGQALAVFGLAAELAAAGAAGPGSLRWRLLDQLAALDETALQEGVRIR